jgi:hypothetical protein
MRVNMSSVESGRAPKLLGGLLALVVLLVIFPPFHIRPLGAEAGAPLAATRDPRQLADQFWRDTLNNPATPATDIGKLLELLKVNAAAAGRLGHTADMGGRPYYFLSGRGRVVSSDPRGLWLDVGVETGADMKVLLLTGPVFGNALRDATGLLPMGDLSFAQFNTLSAEIDRLAESRGEAALHGPVAVGSTLTFVAAGEIDDSGGAPILKLLPVRATVQ